MSQANGESKRISTTQLSKRFGLPTRDLFASLTELGLVARIDEQWVLTDKGREAGGDYRESKQYGRYIVWPDDLPIPSPAPGEKMLSATALGEAFELPARRVNQVLSEHGWIKKHLKGWLVTPLGKLSGGQQRENTQSGVPFVVWPSAVLENAALRDTIGQLRGVGQPETSMPAEVVESLSGFRERFPPKLRTADGHYVRSRAEMLIDNWLYTAEIVHAYERRLPLEEEVYCDFYLPAGKVYIEFWGLESDAQYRARQEEKLAIYRKYQLNLIELHDADIAQLDEILPRQLLKFGITTY